MSNRREFIVQFGLAGSAMAAGNTWAQPAALAEGDAQAAALGYKTDTTKVDAKKYPKHSAEQRCNNCALYQGKAADAAAGCPLFAGKSVAGKGWCTAWAKKA